MDIPSKPEPSTINPFNQPRNQAHLLVGDRPPQKKALDVDFYLSGASRWLLDSAKDKEKLTEEDLVEIMKIAVAIPIVDGRDILNPHEHDIEIAISFRNQSVMESIVESKGKAYNPSFFFTTAPNPQPGVKVEKLDWAKLAADVIAHLNRPD